MRNEMVQEAQSSESSQRIQLEMDVTSSGKRVKIRVERYDDGLGWYTSASLAMPLHQLPLLEQAVDEMRRSSRTEEEFATIIPFPGMISS